MKIPSIICLLALTSFTLLAAPLQIKLHEPDAKVDNDNYESQIIISFKKLLESDDATKKAFKPYIDKAKLKAGDRYRAAVATPVSIMTSMSEALEGEKKQSVVNRTVIIFFSFGAGTQTGSETVSGVFAVFKIKGIYSSKDDGSIDHNVIAKFEGFYDKLTTEQIIAKSNQ